MKEYNAIIGDINKHDQLVLTCETDQSSKFRFYFRVGFNFFDQTIINSRFAWNAIHPDSDVSAKDFMLSVAEGIVADFSSRSYHPGSNKQKTTLTGLIGRPSLSAAAHLPVITTR